MKHGLEITSNGTKHWYENGRLHREDGPAAEYPSGRKDWYLYGVPHRVDGPAFELADGTVSYWLRGLEWKEADFNVEVLTQFLNGHHFK